MPSQGEGWLRVWPFYPACERTDPPCSSSCCYTSPGIMVSIIHVCTAHLCTGVIKLHVFVAKPVSQARFLHVPLTLRGSSIGSPSGGPCDTIHVYVCASSLRIGMIELNVCITKPVSQARFLYVPYTLLGEHYRCSPSAGEHYRCSHSASRQV